MKNNKNNNKKNFNEKELIKIYRTIVVDNNMEVESI